MLFVLVVCCAIVCSAMPLQCPQGCIPFGPTGRHSLWPSTRVSTVSYDTVFFVSLQHREQLQPWTWIKAYTLRRISFSRPKDASGTTDEDFVLLSLRAYCV